MDKSKKLTKKEIEQFKREYESQFTSMPPLNQTEDESYIVNNTPEKVQERLKVYP